MSFDKRRLKELSRFDVNGTNRGDFTKAFNQKSLSKLRESPRPLRTCFEYNIVSHRSPISGSSPHEGGFRADKCERCPFLKQSYVAERNLQCRDHL